jgi:hypothetical protein
MERKPKSARYIQTLQCKSKYREESQKHADACTQAIGLIDEGAGMAVEECLLHILDSLEKLFAAFNQPMDNPSSPDGVVGVEPVACCVPTCHASVPI